MGMIVQEIGIGVETIIAMACAGGECPGPLSASASGPPANSKQKPAESQADQEYMQAMEERYGICDEGFF